MAGVDKEGGIEAIPETPPPIIKKPGEPVSQLTHRQKARRVGKGLGNRDYDEAAKAAAEVTNWDTDAQDGFNSGFESAVSPGRKGRSKAKKEPKSAK